MEQKLHGASKFRSKARPTIAHVARAWIVRRAANTRTQLTSLQFDGFCIEQTEQAAGDLAPNEALRMLEQQSEQLFHGHNHYRECITGAIHVPVAPYVPGHRAPRATEDDQARMAAKLAQRSNPSIQVSTAAQSRNEKSVPESWPTASKEAAAINHPPRPVGELQWEDRAPGSMGRYTKCHWYSCCQIRQGEEVTFEVWTRQPLTSGMRPLHMGLKTFKEAIALAQADADEHSARGDR